MDQDRQDQTRTDQASSVFIGEDGSSEAILLIAHGSRRKAANDDLLTIADYLRQRTPGVHVEVSYLELTTPTIPEGAAACIAAGASLVYMLPFFLSPGVHVAQDLEEFREQFHQRYPHAKFVVCAPMGVHPSLVDILLERLEQARSLTVNDSP